MAKWAQMAVSAVTGVINMVGNMADRFSGLLPILGSAIISFTMFKTLFTTFLPLAQGVGLAITAMKMSQIELTAALRASAIAQTGLNAAMAANPYVLTATAIMTVVAALASMLAGIKAVNAAAGIVSDLSVGGYTQAEREFAARNNLSNSAGKTIYDANANATKLIAEERAKIRENQEWIKTYQKDLSNQNSSLNWYSQTDAEKNYARQQVEVGTDTMSQRVKDYQKKLAEIKEAENNIAYIAKANSSDVAAMAKSDKEMQAAQKALANVNVDTSLDTSGMTNTLGNIASDTGSIADSVDISQENLQYMRDLADRDVINRFTTAEIKVDMTNHNTITNTNDMDGLVTSLSVKLREELAATAEGSYSF